MPNDIDKSLLERLQALRGVASPATPERSAPIEKAKPAAEEDSLAARLRSLRLQYGESPSPTSSSSFPSKSSTKPTFDKNPTHQTEPSSSEAEKSKNIHSQQNHGGPGNDIGDEDVDAMLQTDIGTLEEMLGHVSVEETLPDEPSVTQIRTLLDEISQSIPTNPASGDGPLGQDKNEEDEEGNSEDEEQMDREADQVIARFRDEMELEAALGRDEKDDHERDDDDNDEDENEENKNLDLPSVPSNLDDLPSTTPSTTNFRATSVDINDITARMALLKGSSSIDLPSVPDSKPSSGKPHNRLASKTSYTDDDMDGWCTVCLEDATLQCPACDDDVYCTRCWREMHVGPAAAFDERSHKAVVFNKSKKKKRIAVGAS